MYSQNSLVDKVFQLQTNYGERFEALTLEVFRYQSMHCEVYSDFLQALGIEPNSVNVLEEIPFLPIEFFKTKTVIAKGDEPQVVFTSSGTTGMEVSKHFVADIGVYETSFTKGFELFYGKPPEYCILALLPSYLEREGSSLIYMADHLIKASGYPDSGFYLDDLEGLYNKLKELNGKGQKCLLLGVSFALLDLAEKFPQALSNTIIMETGGMKGRRRELLRTELHETLTKAFSVDEIHSEYGMTELLSQAYSSGEGVFKCPPWMQVLVRDMNDPFQILPNNKTGGLNIIDLANIYSCSFIATKDLGVKRDSSTFEVLGRFDNSDVRGCNLMVV